MTPVEQVPTVRTDELDGPVVVRFEDLVPGWHEAKCSTEAGFLRWLSPYVGGPPGHLHEHPATGLVGVHSTMGVMGLLSGQRQWGVHRHTTTEIYLILRGHVATVEAGGVSQPMGPMDLLYIPREAPHAVRAVGEEDVLLMYVHDDHERLGESRYYADDDPSVQGPDIHPTVVRWNDLEPWWGAPGAGLAGSFNWSVTWAGGGEGRLNLNPGVAAVGEGCAMGATVIAAANAQEPERWETVRYLQVVSGRVSVEGRPDLGVLGAYDVLIVPPGHSHALRAVGLDDATIVWFHEDDGRPLAH
ncbi:unannotated protein [freshwater metagenome]|uniref:Unannotated protein n=1 Tax=freshwater metagenome TaxID=449393 RepID=A0A6J7D541_9ZZZZ|nr:cupin domain-containing protein [Actinomycetota bacterium]